MERYPVAEDVASNGRMYVLLGNEVVAPQYLNVEDVPMNGRVLLHGKEVVNPQYLIVEEVVLNGKMYTTVY